MSIASRRRAIIGAQKSDSKKVLFEWTPSDGLTKINFTGTTAGTQPYIDGDALVVSAGVGKVAKVNIDTQITLQAPATIEYEYDSLVISASKNVRFRAYGVGASSQGRYNINNNLSWMLYSGSTLQYTIPEAIASSGIIKLKVDPTAQTVAYYSSDNFVGECTNVPTSQDHGLLLVEATAIRIRRITIYEGV